MQRILVLLSSTLGAALMFFLDPRSGDRRRSLLRDQLVKMRNDVSEQVEDTAEGIADRTRGAVAETKRQIQEETVSDETLTARIRSDMGHYLSNMGAIDVRVNNGIVMLSGNILASEAETLISRLRTMPGIKRVENHLNVHDTAGNVPDLQGNSAHSDLS